jgi:hypothetical protein
MVCAASTSSAKRRHDGANTAVRPVPFATAPFYGHGLSELRLGRFLRQRERNSFTVSTKVGRILVPPLGEPIDYGIWAAALELKPVFDYSYEGTLRALEQSANRLGFSELIGTNVLTCGPSTPRPPRRDRRVRRRYPTA